MAKDRRLYARFDINMDEHQKLVILSDAAFRALFEGTFYSRRQLSDGFLHERIVMKKWGAEVAAELSSNDPERPSWAKVDGGYQIHDFAEHQTTNADIRAKREAGRAGGLAKAANSLASATNVPESARSNDGHQVASKSHQGASNDASPTIKTPSLNDITDGGDALIDDETAAESSGFVAGAREKPKQKGSTTLAKTETETETTTKKTSSNAAHSKEFESFWEHYPRKVGKLAAKKSFDKATKLTDIGNIQTALHRLNQEVRGKDQQFIPHPATWLNQGRWDDEPTTTKPASSPWRKEFHNG